MDAGEDADKNRTEGTPSSSQRRDFLKLVFALGTVGTVVGLAGFFTEYLTYIPGPPPNLTWPKVKVANLKDLTTLQPLNFNYPLTNTPNILVKLGVKAEKGIGPDGDIVAFSLICQHLGCIYGFHSKGTSPSCNVAYVMPVSGGYCCCHGSHYDFTKEGAVIGGPSPRPEPMVTLEFDQASGDIYATAMGPPSIYGHHTGDTEPSAVMADDLEGGTLVAGITTTVSSSSSGSSTTTTSSSSGSGA